jgi:hypothetical protein
MRARSQPVATVRHRVAGTAGAAVPAAHWSWVRAVSGEAALEGVGHRRRVDARIDATCVGGRLRSVVLACGREQHDGNRPRAQHRRPAYFRRIRNARTTCRPRPCGGPTDPAGSSCMCPARRFSSCMARSPSGHRARTHRSCSLEPDRRDLGRRHHQGCRHSNRSAWRWCSLRRTGTRTRPAARRRLHRWDAAHPPASRRCRRRRTRTSGSRTTSTTRAASMTAYRTRVERGVAIRDSRADRRCDATGFRSA